MGAMSYYQPGLTQGEHLYNQLAALAASQTYVVENMIRTAVSRISQEVGDMARMINKDIMSCDQAWARTQVLEHATLLFPILLPNKIAYNVGDAMPSIPPLQLSIAQCNGGYFQALVTYGPTDCPFKTRYLFSSPATDVPGALQNLLLLTTKLLSEHQAKYFHCPVDLEVVNLAHNEGGYVRQTASKIAMGHDRVLWWDNHQTSNPAFAANLDHITHEIEAKGSDYYSDDGDQW